MSLVDEWRERGVITAAQARKLGEIDSGRLFSLYNEIRTLFYLGVAFLVAGAAATVKKHFHELGEPAILTVLFGAIGMSWGYCFKRALPYSSKSVPSPTSAYDYLLYLGCALLGVLFGYLEVQHHLFKEYWDFYLLISGVLFFFLAYRFDNRFVLALGLINLAGWWGLRFAHWDVPGLSWETRALTFGLAAIVAGLATAFFEVKRHFESVYLTAGLHAVYWALLPGVFRDGLTGIDFYGLITLSGATIFFARKRRQFSYFLYAVAYGYIAGCWAILKALELRASTDAALFLLLSATAVIVGLLAVRRQFEQDNS